jgi:hypothetical protein
VREFEKLVERLNKDGWKQQSAGSNYIDGTIGTSFIKNGRVLSVSLDCWPDEEVVEQLFE